MLPLISIIVPIYNTKEYLPRCVHSLTAQTYENIEILLVDDGSTDGTGALCDELGTEDVRIRVLHKENGGSSSARNLGLGEAHGEYIGFVDSDDSVSPEMYALLYDGIVKYGVKVAQIGRDEIAPDGSYLPNICEPPEKPVCISPEEFLQELLMHRGDCSFCTKLFARELFVRTKEAQTATADVAGDGIGNARGSGDAGENAAEEADAGTADIREGRAAALRRSFPVGALNEDFRLLVSMLADIGPIVSLPQQCYHVFYRLGSNSRKESALQFSRVYADSVENADWVAAQVAEQYPAHAELQEVAFRFGVFQRIEYLLHIPIPQMRCRKGRDGYNAFYDQTVRTLRSALPRALRNPYLTGKNKVYAFLLGLAPKVVRRLHRMVMRLRGA